jgi:DNA-binding NtrC family response regulator
VSLVLVVAKDAVIGSLMASLTEIAGYDPVFPAADESVSQAITRLKPDILLLDCDEPAAVQQEPYVRAADAGTRVILFTPSRTEREVRRLAAERALTSFALPIQPSALGAILSGSGNRESGIDKRHFNDGTASL